MRERSSPDKNKIIKTMAKKIQTLITNPIVKRWLKGFVATVLAAAGSAALNYLTSTVPNLLQELGWQNLATLAVLIASILAGEKAIPKNL
jgi:hypothetical protein